MEFIIKNYFSERLRKIEIQTIVNPSNGTSEEVRVSLSDGAWTCDWEEKSKQVDKSSEGQAKYENLLGIDRPSSTFSINNDAPLKKRKKEERPILPSTNNSKDKQAKVSDSNTIKPLCINHVASLFKSKLKTGELVKCERGESCAFDHKWKKWDWNQVVNAFEHTKTKWLCEPGTRSTMVKKIKANGARDSIN